jgi:hypothetical protein
LKEPIGRLQAKTGITVHELSIYRVLQQMGMSGSEFETLANSRPPRKDARLSEVKKKR